jgi:hypothetical protein
MNNAGDRFIAGWNMPGYLPDSEPSIFCDLGDALAGPCSIGAHCLVLVKIKGIRSCPHHDICN